MQIHVMMQKKGGAAKSTCAAFLADYLREQRRQRCLSLDLDPGHSSFTKYRALDVHRVQLMDRDKEVDPTGFDEVMEIIEGDHDQLDHMVIDTGSDGFSAMVNHLVSHDFLERATDQGHHVLIHTTIIGGEALVTTLECFEGLTESFPPPAGFVIWLSPHTGRVEGPGEEPFQSMKTYARLQQRIDAVIEVPLLGKSFNESLCRALAHSFTLSEATRTDLPAFKGDDKYRVSKFRKLLWAQLDQVFPAPALSAE